MRLLSIFESVSRTRTFRTVAKLNSWQKEYRAVPFPLSYLEINAWARLARIEFEPWEFSALELIDEAYVNHYADEATADKPKMQPATNENLAMLFRTLAASHKAKR